MYEIKISLTSEECNFISPETIERMRHFLNKSEEECAKK